MSNNNTGTGVLTISALTNDHSIGDRVSVVSGSDKTISAGLQVQVPAVGDTAAIVFVTIEGGTIVAGDYESTPISAKALVP
ncbi:MAG: hypothetical protein GTO54_11825, partial [Nitrososphaeria archaeon]|nr:hypothetical protein [Nitrososphaeria archaeon]